MAYMLTLINTNTMIPAVSPIGLDYIAETVSKVGIKVDIVDLCLSDDPINSLKDYFANHTTGLVGVSFRNVDDCFWPSAKWFVPGLAETVRTIRNMTDAPIVVGGVGFSIFAQRIVEYTGADFGICGDGEQAIVSLFNELQKTKCFEKVDGLIWHRNGEMSSNPPAWNAQLSLPTNRDAIDNQTYFQKGGQCGLETKRGCNRKCIYCADPLAKGTTLRLRKPSEVADEAESLIAKGIDVLHLCDSEFNIPPNHAYAVCEEFKRRSVGKQLRWYTYMAVVPFDTALAKAMRNAGCVGIDFTGDSACPKMLKTYRQPHLKKDLASAVHLCRQNGIKVMIDLLLGGPGETALTAAETIDFIKKINPDCAGAPLGVRIYPNTEMAHLVAAEGPLETNPNIRRKYPGTVDFFRPTFYISAALGEQPAALIQDLIAGDKRFFGPVQEQTPEADVDNPSTDHNYNDNAELVEAVKKGARGAYWHILRELRSS
ncbi:MAG: radical SAM protein [Planctomycetota bacterium]|nr:MAG: radical SAM protein [Planctomycetota bacterium]